MSTPAPSPTFEPLASKRSMATLADSSAAVALFAFSSSDDGLLHAATAPRELTRTPRPAAARTRFIMVTAPRSTGTVGRLAEGLRRAMRVVARRGPTLVLWFSRGVDGRTRCRTEQVLRARDRSMDRDFTA